MKCSDDTRRGGHRKATQTDRRTDSSTCVHSLTRSTYLARVGFANARIADAQQASAPATAARQLRSFREPPVGSRTTGSERGRSATEVGGFCVARNEEGVGGGIPRLAVLGGNGSSR
ncbi:unnamed protein product [Lampetra fluviatilis]